MKKGRIARAVFLLVGLAVIAGLAYLVWQRYAGGTDHPNWDKVHFGHSREQVVELLGEPDEETAAFPLSSAKDRAEAEERGVQVWLIYRRGPGVTYAIGLAKDGRVVFKARGGT